MATSGNSKTDDSMASACSISKFPEHIERTFSPFDIETGNSKSDDSTASAGNSKSDVSMTTQKNIQCITTEFAGVSAEELREALTYSPDRAWGLVLSLVSGGSDFSLCILRNQFNRSLSWGSPTLESLNKILLSIPKGQNVLSICSGNSLIEYWFIGHGIPVTMTDIAPMFPECEQLTAKDAATKYRDTHSVLLVSWPPYDKPFAADALRAGNFTTVIYIGEGHGGCTADDTFHDMLDEGYSCEDFSSKQWYGIHEYPRVYSRDE